MKSFGSRILLLVVTLLVALLLAEVLLRVLPERAPRASGEPPRNYLATLDGVELTPEVVAALGLMEPLDPSPRPRLVFKPGTRLRMCYTGPAQPYFDERGCIEVAFNSAQIRDREELCAPKPPGGKRILCLGDSFTFGWGVRAEDAWPRLLEERLRRAHGEHVRTVNCGAAGTLFVDEYALGLEARFQRFEPDVVLVSLCLNDLLNVNGGLTHTGPATEAPPLPPPPWWMPRLLQELRARSAPLPLPPTLRLDPRRDWTRILLDMPADHRRYAEGLGREVFWAGGGPQTALLAMREWCERRGLPFLVVVWPLFQGLGDDEFYPFATMHALVAAFCAEQGIPCLDLLPTFRGHASTTLWVSPGDQHGNRKAQRLAAGPIAEFVEANAQL